MYISISKNHQLSHQTTNHTPTAPITTTDSHPTAPITLTDSHPTTPITPTDSHPTTPITPTNSSSTTTTTPTDSTLNTPSKDGNPPTKPEKFTSNILRNITCVRGGIGTFPCHTTHVQIHTCTCRLTHVLFLVSKSLSKLSLLLPLLHGNQPQVVIHVHIQHTGK